MTPNYKRTVLLALGAAALVLALPRVARGDDESEEEEADDGGSSLFYVNFEGGYHAIDLATFDADGDILTANVVPTRADGPTAALAFGIRPWFFLLGLRTSMTWFNDRSLDRTVGDYRLVNLDLDLGFVLPFVIIEPYLILGAGYSRFGGLEDAISGISRGVDIDGANLHGAVGADIYPVSFLSLGARASGQILFLSRPGVPLRDLATPETVDNLSEAERRILEGDGSSVGAGYQLTGVLGLHF